MIRHDDVQCKTLPPAGQIPVLPSVSRNPDHRGDGFGRHHEAAVGQTDAETFFHFQHAHEFLLVFQRKVAVAAGLTRMQYVSLCGVFLLPGIIDLVTVRFDHRCGNRLHHKRTAHLRLFVTTD